jgi:hypothetical protein
MKRTIIIISVVVIFILALVIALVLINLPPRPPPIINLSERKAIIVGSANDFFGSESEGDFNNGDDAQFGIDTGRWISNFTNGYGGSDSSFGHDGTPGAVHLIALTNGYVNMEYTYNWTAYRTLYEYAFYNFSAWVNIPTMVGVPGARIGLRWLNLGNVVRTDWSNGLEATASQWKMLNVSGVCNNETGNKITQLQLILAVEGVMTGGDEVFFDDLRIDRWVSVNLTHPTDPDPPPTKLNSDGFPAQALHVYWILKNHGYTDDNIFFMLYHTNDNIIDIKAGDGIANDLLGAVIDVENDDVNASRFKQELNASISGSFASYVDENDKLIIFMTDHGSNRVLGDGNATFHFEVDNSFISEFDFYDLVKGLEYERLMINVDCCFSGNFLNKNKNIGVSWYDIPNCIFVSAASNILSWYWINNLNGDGFAGSWFFHPFWEQLNQNQTIANAFNFALGFIPAGRFQPVAIIQMPLLYDNIGINATLSFSSDPPL